MEANEKARELYRKYEFIYIQNYTSKFEVKQCALIAVEEICEAIDWHEFEHPNKEWDYWQQVKTEIQKL